MLTANLSFSQPVNVPSQASASSAPVFVASSTPVQTVQAVGNAPVNQRIENNSGGHNSQGNQSAAPANQNLPATIPASTSFSIPPIPSALNGLGGISSLFVVSLMTQSFGATPALLEGYEQMVQASQVKYLPSNAALPSQPNPGDAFRMMMTDQAPQAQRMQANQIQTIAAQQANENAAASTRPQNTSATISGNIVQFRNFDLSVPQRRDMSSPASLRLQKSLLSENGASAYRATDVRNVIHLELIEPIDLVG